MERYSPRSEHKMISNNDRSGYFGASDTDKVLAANYTTKTFKQWWAVKLGEQEPEFHGNVYTDAGNRYEHAILKTINENMTLDRQIIVDKYLLRVNYDGDYNGTIYEVKTHKSDREYEISTTHRRQTQVEMFAYKTMMEELKLPPFKRLYIVSYALFPDEYYGETVEVDFNRIKFHEVEYDKHFIKGEYLPKLKEKARALKKGKFIT